MRGHIHTDFISAAWGFASTVALIHAGKMGAGWLAAHNVPGGALLGGLLTFG